MIQRLCKQAATCYHSPQATPITATRTMKESEGSMAHYFTREEAEALLPQISIVLLKIQEHRRAMQQTEEELSTLRAQSMNNGHHLHERIERLQKTLVEHIEALQALARELRDRSEEHTSELQ